MAQPIAPLRKPDPREVRGLTAKVPKNVWRALRVYCALEDKDVAGIVALALKRYLTEHGGPQVQPLLRD